MASRSRTQDSAESGSMFQSSEAKSTFVCDNQPVDSHVSGSLSHGSHTASGGAPATPGGAPATSIHSAGDQELQLTLGDSMASLGEVDAVRNAPKTEDMGKVSFKRLTVNINKQREWARVGYSELLQMKDKKSVEVQEAAQILEDLQSDGDIKAHVAYAKFGLTSPQMDMVLYAMDHLRKYPRKFDIYDAVIAVMAVKIINFLPNIKHYLSNECSVCSTMFPKHKMADFFCHESTEETINFCQKCARDFFSRAIENQSCQQLACPATCGVPGMHITQREYSKALLSSVFPNIGLSTKTIKNFEQQVQPDLTSHLYSRIYWCNKQDCNGSGFGYDDGLQYFTCLSCEGQACKICQKLWVKAHKNKTCAEFSQWRPTPKSRSLATLSPDATAHVGRVTEEGTTVFGESTVLQRGEGDPDQSVHLEFGKCSMCKMELDADTKCIFLCHSEDTSKEQFCRSCMKRHFTNSINLQKLDEFFCPANCGAPGELMERELYLDFLKLLLKEIGLPSKMLEKFEGKLVRWKMSTLSGFYKCIAPSCTYGFIDEGVHPCIHCPECKKSMCRHCRKMWTEDHGITTCTEAGKWDLSALQTGGLAIQCPECREHLQFGGGAMGRECPKCQKKFCLCCLERMFRTDCPHVEEWKCGSQGLHAHHPRNCYERLRDCQCEKLQKLLKDNQVDFTSGKTGNSCKETISLDNIDKFIRCDGKEEEAELCQTHYRKYLIGKINANKLEVLPLLERNHLKRELNRYGFDSPSDEGMDNEKYKGRLIEEIESKIPLADLSANSVF